MKIVKRILQGFGIIIGVIVFYLSVVTFVPGFKVPEQPLEQGKLLIKELVTKPSWIRKDVSFKVGIGEFGGVDFTFFGALAPIKNLERRHVVKNIYA